MKRRHFLYAAAASALLPAAAMPCASALARWQRRDYAFFDDRFPKAYLAVSSWLGLNARIGVQGDITALWNNGLDRMAREHPLCLRGVTMQSFFFCLKILIGEYSDLQLQVSRLDRNLLRWTMYTVPRFDHGATRDG